MIKNFKKAALASASTVAVVLSLASVPDSAQAQGRGGPDNNPSNGGDVSTDGNCGSSGCGGRDRGRDNKSPEPHECGVTPVEINGNWYLMANSTQFEEGNTPTLFTIEPRMGDSYDAGKAGTTYGPISLSNFADRDEIETVSRATVEASGMGFNVRDEFTLAECAHSQALDFARENIRITVGGTRVEPVVSLVQRGTHADSQLRRLKR